MPFYVVSVMMLNSKAVRGTTYVAVEEPDAWIVCAEAHDEVASRSHQQCVPPYRNSRELVYRGAVWAEFTGVFGGAGQNLELMAVKVEWMLAGIQVVEHDVDNLVLLQNERVRVAAIDFDTVCGVARGEDCVKSRDKRLYIGHIIDKGAGNR